MIQFQRQIAERAHESRPLIVSISIDPTFDQTAVLRDYARSYGADWEFLTGSQDDIVNVLKAFNAYRGSKVNHFPLTLFTDVGQDQWVRVEGLESAKRLVEVWEKTLEPLES